MAVFQSVHAPTFIFLGLCLALIPSMGMAQVPCTITATLTPCPVTRAPCPSTATTTPCIPPQTPCPATATTTPCTPAPCTTTQKPCTVTTTPCAPSPCPSTTLPPCPTTVTAAPCTPAPCTTTRQPSPVTTTPQVSTTTPQASATKVSFTSWVSSTSSTTSMTTTSSSSKTSPTSTTTTMYRGPVHVETDASDLHEAKKFLEVSTKPSSPAASSTTKFAMASWAAALLCFLALVAASILAFFHCQAKPQGQPVVYTQAKPNLEEAPLLEAGISDVESQLLSRAPHPPLLEIDRRAAVPEVKKQVVEVPEVVQKIVEVPEVVERVVEVLQVQTIEKHVEVPEVRYVDKVVEVRKPCCGPCGRGSRVEVPKRS